MHKYGAFGLSLLDQGARGCRRLRIVESRIGKLPPPHGQRLRYGHNALVNGHAALGVIVSMVVVSPWRILASRRCRGRRKDESRIALSPIPSAQLLQSVSPFFVAAATADVPRPQYSLQRLIRLRIIKSPSSSSMMARFDRGPPPWSRCRPPSRLRDFVDNAQLVGDDVNPDSAAWIFAWMLAALAPSSHHA